MSNPIAAYPKINEGVKDLFATTAGILILRGLGMKCGIGQLNIKTIAFGALLTATAGATGREVANWKTGGSQNQNTRTSMYRLATLVTFSAGALALTQYNKARALMHLSAFTQFASRNQGIAVGIFTITSMVARHFFGGTKTDLGGVEWLNSLSEEVLKTTFEEKTNESLSKISPEYKNNSNLDPKVKNIFNEVVEIRNKSISEESGKIGTI